MLKGIAFAPEPVEKSSPRCEEEREEREAWGALLED